MRDQLTHHYFVTQRAIVSRVVNEALTVLREAVERLRARIIGRNACPLPAGHFRSAVSNTRVNGTACSLVGCAGRTRGRRRRTRPDR